MKNILTFILPLVLVLGSYAQSHNITKDEYDSPFRFAVSETNAAFPFVFTVRTESFEDGKIVSSVTEINERQSRGRERTMITTVTGGQTTVKYQIKVDFGNNFCSEDGVNWTPSKYECSGPVSFYGPRNPEKVEYNVTETEAEGKRVKIYRQYSIFAPLIENGKKEFREKIATIDSRGFFIDIVETEGTLDPLIIGLKRKQSWDTKTKIKPIVAPIK